MRHVGVPTGRFYTISHVIYLIGYPITRRMGRLVGFPCSHGMPHHMSDIFNMSSNSSVMG